MSTITIPESESIGAATPGATASDPATNSPSVPDDFSMSPPTGRAGLFVASTAVAGRTLRHFWRTPQLIVVGALTSAMFLLIFRYVFGGAIQTGSVEYVNYLIPALAVSTGLFASGAIGVADDIESGLFDRLRSLPIPRPATLIGRSLADTALVAWGAFITVALGFATGFRIHGGVGLVLAAFALCVLFGWAFTWLFIYMGLTAGSPQAAQGMSFLSFPLVFVSSAYVPVASMPSWMQPFAENQPATMMIGAVRSLTLGDQAEAILGHSAGWFIIRAVLWAVAFAVVFGVLSARKFAKS